MLYMQLKNFCPAKMSTIAYTGIAKFLPCSEGHHNYALHLIERL